MIIGLFLIIIAFFSFISNKKKNDRFCSSSSSSSQFLIILFIIYTIGTKNKMKYLSERRILLLFSKCHYKRSN